jgi:chromosome partitioning protein
MTEREQPPVTIVAIASHKGGVGKTTTTIQLGTGLSVAGVDVEAVILVDADAQGHLGEYLGVGAGGDFADALLGQKAIEDCLVKAKGYERLWVMRGGLATWNAEQVFVRDGVGDTPLADRLRQMLDLLGQVAEKHGQVVVLIDTGPGFSEIQTAVLVVADYILCPLTPSVGGQIGMNAIWEWLGKIGTRAKAKGFGILPQMYNISNPGDVRLLRSVQLQPEIGPHVYEVIPYSEAMARALDVGLSVWEVKELSKDLVGKRFAEALERLATELEIKLRVKRRKS